MTGIVSDLWKNQEFTFRVFLRCDKNVLHYLTEVAITAWFNLGAKGFREMFLVGPQRGRKQGR